MGYCSLQDNKITIRPKLDQANIEKKGVPTAVIVGVFRGYSLPIYNDDDEELYYTTMVPDRWDSATDPKVVVYCCLNSAETVGNKFNLQLSYQTCSEEGIIPTTTNDVPIETTVLEGHASQYDSYRVYFDLDATKLGGGYLLACRLRRLDSSGTDTGEINIGFVELEFKVNKCFGEWIY